MASITLTPSEQENLELFKSVSSWFHPSKNLYLPFFVTASGNSFHLYLKLLQGEAIEHYVTLWLPSSTRNSGQDFLIGLMRWEMCPYFGGLAVVASFRHLTSTTSAKLWWGIPKILTDQKIARLPLSSRVQATGQALLLFTEWHNEVIGERYNVVSCKSCPS